MATSRGGTPLASSFLADSYLERAINALRGHAAPVDDALLQFLSPLGWEHINLTGDYRKRLGTAP